MKGNSLAIQVQRNIYLICCKKRLLNGLETKYNAQSKIVFDAPRELMTAPEEPMRGVGFHS